MKGEKIAYWTDFHETIYQQNQNYHKSNKFLELNDLDMYFQEFEGSSCQFLDCDNKAIGSHTYPKSFLKKFSRGKPVYSTSIREIYGSIYSSKELEILKKSSINYSGVNPLFCTEHDTNVFKRIELKNHVTDLDTYICLFLYRAFINDYVLEKHVKNPDVDIKINEKKDYSKRISQEEKISYIGERKILHEMLDMQYDYKIYEQVKKKFDIIFGVPEPLFNDFKKEFTLKYYELNYQSKMLATGTMFFNKNSILNYREHLPSIYGIVPDIEGNKYYFAILIPKESLRSMRPVIKYFNKEYKRYLTNSMNSFVKWMEFMLLDASQNIIISQKSINDSSEKNEILKRISFCLNYARSNRILGFMWRDTAFKLLDSINLSN